MDKSCLCVLITLSYATEGTFGSALMISEEKGPWSKNSSQWRRSSFCPHKHDPDGLLMLFARATEHKRAIKRHTAAADQTSSGRNIRYVESNAISSFPCWKFLTPTRRPYEKRRKPTAQRAARRVCGQEQRSDFNPQIYVRTRLEAEVSSNVVHIFDVWGELKPRWAKGRL